MKQTVWIVSVGEQSQGHDPVAVFSQRWKAVEYVDTHWPEHTHWIRHSMYDCYCRIDENKVDEIFLTSMTIDDKER